VVNKLPNLEYITVMNAIYLHIGVGSW